MVEAIQTVRYKAFDGSIFDTEAEAKAHEEQHFAALLCGLSRQDVDDALDRKPFATALSDAIEKAGAIIARKRREAGELRRARNADKSATEPPTPEAERDAA